MVSITVSVIMLNTRWPMSYLSVKVNYHMRFSVFYEQLCCLYEVSGIGLKHCAHPLILLSSCWPSSVPGWGRWVLTAEFDLDLGQVCWFTQVLESWTCLRWLAVWFMTRRKHVKHSKLWCCLVFVCIGGSGSWVWSVGYDGDQCRLAQVGSFGPRKCW